jgi:rare lipoprotein A
MPALRTIASAVCAVVCLSGFTIDASQARNAKNERFAQTGVASWYGPGFHGRKTASGEPFDQNRLTAAHRSLPLDSVVKVTNLENGKSVEVEINARGPYAKGRVIDLSRAAARHLDMTDDGTAKVRIERQPDRDTDNETADAR